MPLQTQPPETDLIVPLPGEGEDWDPHMIHTHFFPFCSLESGLGVFTYIRYHPRFPLCQGGVLAFKGLDNIAPSDMTFHDYEMTMPWPCIEGNRFTTANGLSYDIVEPGKRALIEYRSLDGQCTIDVEATAITPLAARGHVMPGEEMHRADEPGGSEQFMHYTGEIVIRGERHAVDCNYIRDRSWRQIRKEARETGAHPPITWTPVYFDEDFAFNQIGFEVPGDDREWAGAYEVPEGAPLHHWAWVSRNGEVRDVKQVRRVVTESHPITFAPLKMEIEVTDEADDTYELKGEAIALSPIPTWPNLTAFDSLFRWEDDRGVTGYGTAQTAWDERVQHTLKAKRSPSLSARVGGGAEAR
jgi:hypothetical protein